MHKHAKPQIHKALLQIQQRPPVKSARRAILILAIPVIAILALLNGGVAPGCRQNSCSPCCGKLQKFSSRLHLFRSCGLAQNALNSASPSGLRCYCSLLFYHPPRMHLVSVLRTYVTKQTKDLHYSDVALLWFISEVFRFEILGFEQVEEDFYKVYFRNVESEC